MSDQSYDVIFAGGGLSATLAAYYMREKRPQLRILMLEAHATLGGNHTWSFHDSDISALSRAWVAPFIAQSWPKQDVRFPKYNRTLPIGYNTIASELLHKAAIQKLHDSVRFGVTVQTVTPETVTLSTGEVLRGKCVIDARGQKPAKGLTLGYQKFVGIEVRLTKPHGQDRPIIMDATVPQRDGYRFVYTLPFSADRLLIEDTYYSDTPMIDLPFLRNECLNYAQCRGWSVAEIVREETGVLPIVLSGSVDAILEQNTSGVPALGLRAGFFHHTTSYSFPFAVKTAEAIAALSPLTSGSLDAEMQIWAKAHWRQQRFFRLLNRMLFWAAEPDRRYRVLERFYSLGEPLIGRFYNSGLTLADQARILAGWPPVPIGRALRVLGETAENPIPRPASVATR